MKQTIHGYEILEELGNGFSGTTYLCSLNGKKFAHKVLRDDAPDELVSRFQREVEIQSGLDHPNIVPVLAAFLAGAPLSYVMPLFECTMEDKVAEIRQSPARLIRITDQLLNGLEHAHANGVLHRDLKPRNILWRSGDVIALADFGEGRVQTDKSPRLTRSGDQLGTAAYSAPEQLNDPGSATKRSDIFGMGAVIYEVWTGTRLYGLPHFPDSFDEGMKNIISKCLHSNPHHRYASVEELRSEFEDVQNAKFAASSVASDEYDWAYRTSEAMRSGRLWVQNRLLKLGELYQIRMNNEALWDDGDKPGEWKLVFRVDKNRYAITITDDELGSVEVKPDVQEVLSNRCGQLIKNLSKEVNAHKATASTQNTAQIWRSERLQVLRRSQGFVSLEDGPKLFIHIYPLQSPDFRTIPEAESVISERDMQRQRSLLQPVQRIDDRFTAQANHLGILSIKKFVDSDVATGYVQLWRTGLIESARTLHVTDSLDAIFAPYLESDLVESIRLYLSALHELALHPPFFLGVSLSDMKGKGLVNRSTSEVQVGDTSFDVNDFDAPSLTVTSWDSILHDEAAKATIRPVLESIWNAAGLSYSTTHGDRQAIAEKIQRNLDALALKRNARKSLLARALEKAGPDAELFWDKSRYSAIQINRILAEVKLSLAQLGNSGSESADELLVEVSNRYLNERLKEELETSFTLLEADAAAGRTVAKDSAEVAALDTIISALET